MIEYVKSLKKYEIALLIANAFILAGVICFCFTKENLFFNSDSSAANMLARCMAENGSLFPSGWVYSTSPMVWFLNIPIAFLSLFMSDQLLMRSISVLLFVIIAVVDSFPEQKDSEKQRLSVHYAVNDVQHIQRLQ